MDNSKGRLYYGTAIDNSQLRTGANEAKGLLRDIGKTAQDEGAKIDQSFNKIAQAAAGIFAVSKLKDFVTQVANVRGQFQQLEIAFETMLGSAEKADKLMSQLIKTAATTPFGMSDIAQAAKQLLAYGVEANKVNETLIRLGDIAAGLSIPIGDLAYLYGTTMTQGKLFTQDLRQFMGRGIPLADELAKQFGVTKDKVGELVTVGKVGFPEVEKAIIAMTSEGSKFGGLMEAQSKTITGQISNIEDSIEQMFNTIGQQQEGIISDTLEAVSFIVDHWEEVGKVLLTVIASYGAYKAAVIAVAAAHRIAAMWETISAFISLTREVKTAKDAMLLFNMACRANPLGLVVSVLATAAAAFALFADRTSDAAKAEQEFNKREKELNDKLAEQAQRFDELKKKKDLMGDVNKKVAEDTAEQISKVETLKNRIKDETLSLEARRKAIKDLQGIVPKYHASLTSEGKLHETNKKAVDEYLESLNKLAIAKALQAKREELTAQKINADLAKIEAQKKKQEAQDAYTAAKNKTAKEQKAYDAAMESAREANGGNMLAGFKESQVAMQGAHMLNSQQLNAARKVENQAKKELEVATNEVKLQQQSFDEAVGQLKTLDQYVEDNKIDLSIANTTTTTTPTEKEKEKAAREAERLKKEAQERAKAMDEYQKAVSAQNREAELELRQERINLLDDGVEKELKQVQLNYDRLTYENEKRQQQMIDELAKNKINEWVDKNPKAKQSEINEYAAGLKLSVSDLSADQQAQLKAYDALAEEIRIKGNRDALQQMMADVMTYEQQRAKIEQDFAKKRSALYETDKDGKQTDKLRQGVTQGNLDELQRQQDEALSAVDEQFASRSELYQAWCNEIGTMTLKQLEAVLKEAEAELQKLSSDPNANPEAVATARAKVKTAKDKVSKAKAENDVSPNKRSIKEWEDLYSTLQTCEGEFEKIGQAVGGVAGEIISTAGSIASSSLQMINGIVTLANSSAAATKGTAIAAASAISTMEKASVILTVISAALQIAMTIASLFNNDDDLQEDIEDLQDRIDGLQWQLDNQDIVRWQKEYGTALSHVSKAMAETRQEMILTAEASGDFWEMFHAYTSRISSDGVLLEKTAKKIADVYANMSYTADKALGENKFNSAREQLENIAQQQIMIREQIDAEKDKKHTDWGQIQDWQQKIEELTQDALNLINEMVETIIGGTSDEIASQLADAFFDAADAGEDAMEAWGKKAKEIVAQVIKNMLVQKYLSERLGEVFDKYKAKWFQNGNFIGIQGVIDSMASFTNDLNAVGNEWVAIWESLPQELKEQLNLVDETREGASKGIAQASQESVDKLDGTATSIQGHTYSIMENTKMLLQTCNLILQNVIQIESHTDTMSSRMASVESDVRSVKNTLNDIALKGIKVK